MHSILFTTGLLVVFEGAGVDFDKAKLGLEQMLFCLNSVVLPSQVLQ